MKRALAVVLPILLTVIVCVLAEVRPNFHAPRLVQLCAIVALLIYVVGRMRGRWRDGLLVAVSVLASVAVIEGACVALEAPNANEDNGGLVGVAPVVGYAPSHPGRFAFVKTMPNGNRVCDVRITIGKDGIRETKAAAGPGTTAFFGDSFTFGDCVEDADTLPQSYADARKGVMPVRNLAFSGWSPAQNLAVLQTGYYRALMDKPSRFVLVTAAWHIERTSCKAPFVKTAPRYVLAPDGALTREGECQGAAKQAWTGFFQRFAAYRKLVAPILAQPSRHDVDTYVAIVRAFVDTAKHDYGAPVTVLYLPYGDGYLKGSGYSEHELEAALAKTGADVLVDHLPPITDPSLYAIANDGHPTGLANRARAKELADHLDALAAEPKKAGADQSSAKASL